MAKHTPTLQERWTTITEYLNLSLIELNNSELNQILSVNQF